MEKHKVLYDNSGRVRFLRINYSISLHVDLDLGMTSKHHG